MALTSSEEALVRQLLDQQAAILSLAGNEATITSKLGATKVTLSDLMAASSVGENDLLLIRQATTDKSVRAALIKAFVGSFVQDSEFAIPRAYQDVLREHISIFDFLTEAQIADVKSYTFSVDVTASVQTAMNEAFRLNMDLFAPAGGYSVTGLRLPGRVSGDTDDRGKAFRMYGQGTGEAFVVGSPKGTVFKSTTNAPVIQDYEDTAVSSNGSVEIDHIRLDGTSSTPVLQLDSFRGMGYIHDCVVYQRGTGDGVKVTLGPTTSIHRVYSFNKDWATYSLGAARVGIGFNFAITHDGGLQNVSNCTSRGWLTAYQVSNAGGAALSMKIEKSECSVTYNGVILIGTRKATLDCMYMEGGDGGKGIFLQSADYTDITGNLIFPGYSIGIDDRDTTNKGTNIQGNTISLGAVVNAWGIALASSATYGGFNKTARANSIPRTDGTAGQIGIFIDGTDARLSYQDNSFDPKEKWNGAGAGKIARTATSAPFGMATIEDDNYEVPKLNRGAISLHKKATNLTESSVSANNMTIPEGSYFGVAATVATTVQRFTGGIDGSRLVTLRTENANLTIQNTAYNKLAGGVSFTGPGTITFLMEYVGGATYAYEQSRATF